MKTHLCQSITGPLMAWTKKDWKAATRWIKRKDGTAYTADELKGEFIKELAQGHEVIPIGECDNFDYKKGCMGHPE